ncbi:MULTISPECIES: hypothetical protein [Clostridium]|jgi:hypothetical protein|uniref:Protein containing Zn-finger domain n=3 Tax=Clostridium beijerinckii TaxID=1520 RepID=A0A1S8QPP5_CLOBE|nr:MULTISPECIES: hypothetical protein [Clostridium]ABR34715.1 conserved hypothetical protein [Clostridium beijerinckii NCIMB 8052]AIU01101.1 hypothetical protein Cbs_2559 [Clostridium beijerinckii ATCC 35702]ALB46190.1 hypothetical protein X276_13555 [Clostridium beijerinckii NRRL B-598]AVK46694.1 hypothetical protein AXY43_00910 [Clostridium sp. MF28]MBC2457638.1 hypothetical protein [Clostridium beijerinckii]
MTYKYTDDDYCDIYENKICDNCGKCLQINGIDTKAIKIEDIAKTQEENELLEEEFLNDLKASLSEDELHEINEDKLDLKSIYNKFAKTSNDIDVNDFNLEDSAYEDAFDHIEYLDEISLDDDLILDEMTEEVYPGVRRLKKSIE